MKGTHILYSIFFEAFAHLPQNCSPNSGLLAPEGNTDTSALLWFNKLHFNTWSRSQLDGHQRHGLFYEIV